MTISRGAPLLIGALVISTQLMAADGCPDLESKDAATHLEYLRGDRAKLSSQCIVAAIRYVGYNHYTQASSALIHYLDYADPIAVARRGIILEVYPAIDALYSLRRPVVPELTAAIAEAETPELVREHAAIVILFLFGANQPEAIAILVSAARAQTDPVAAIRLMDKARWLAARCIEANRNECENAVLK
jgi:hypothetical protein